MEIDKREIQQKEKKKKCTVYILAPWHMAIKLLANTDMPPEKQPDFFARYTTSMSTHLAFPTMKEEFFDLQTACISTPRSTALWCMQQSIKDHLLIDTYQH